MRASLFLLGSLALVLTACQLKVKPQAVVPAHPSFETVPAWSGLRFQQPLQVVFAPGDTNSVFVVEHGGVIAVLRDRAKPKREVFLDLNELGQAFDQKHGALSMAFHSKFSENGLFYVWFSVQSATGRSNRLARFKVAAGNPAVGEIASQLPMITQPTGPHGHDGADLLFGPEGYLYVSLGDGDEHLLEPMLTHQRIDRSFFGAILRIDVDQRPGSLAPNPHAAVHAGSYAVPPDNPFIGVSSFNGKPVAPNQVRTEFWAVGLRNPWRMAFDSATGRLWCGDVGLKLREEVDVIVRGGNYGWDFREGISDGPRARSTPKDASLVSPIWDYGREEGISVTGGFVYHGKNFPELEGKYLFADYGMGTIWALEPNGDHPVDASRVKPIATADNVVAFTMDPLNGDVLLTCLGGKILRLARQEE